MLKELEKEKTKNPHSQIYQRLRQLFPGLSPLKPVLVEGVWDRGEVGQLL
jgi:hypothetical protein